MFRTTYYQVSFLFVCKILNHSSILIWETIIYPVRFKTQSAGRVLFVCCIYGTIYSFQGGIPKSLSGCSGLHYLVLGENYFTGNIPAWIGESLSGLSFLSLTSNYFNGSLPSTLCHLPNLQVLDICIFQ